MTEYLFAAAIIQALILAYSTYRAHKDYRLIREMAGMLASRSYVDFAKGEAKLRKKPEENADEADAAQGYEAMF